MATYASNSPYYHTTTFSNGKFLDIAQLPTIPFSNSDTMFKINTIYQFRPDLLANDLYGDSGLWWVFAIRNPSIITDPIFSMRSGISIYIPNKANLLNLVS